MNEQPPDEESARWGKVAAEPDEIRLLEGPQKRGNEFARVLRITMELIRGFRALHFVGPCVSVFGSARFSEEHPYYELAREVGAQLGRYGFTVMTGGGPGIMEAANRGARDVRAPSIGCNIKLPHEQKPNAYLDKWLEFRYFFVRKLMLVKYSYAFIALPGGFGTLDEMFETATLIQTGKISDFPLVLLGSEFWQPMLGFMRQTLVTRGTIEPADVDRFFVTDSANEAVEHVRETAMKRFGLSYAGRQKRRWWMLEK
jgi:uncharacterized protein (TIGR00730 family)